jgi:hypothetical protein
MKIELDNEKKILNVLCDCGVRGKISIDASGNPNIESIAGEKKDVLETKKIEKKEKSFLESLLSDEDSE